MMNEGAVMVGTVAASNRGRTKVREDGFVPPRDPRPARPPDRLARTLGEEAGPARDGSEGPTRERPVPGREPAGPARQSGPARDGSEGPTRDKAVPGREPAGPVQTGGPTRDSSRTRIQTYRDKQRDITAKESAMLLVEEKPSIDKIREEKAAARRRQRDEIYALNALMRSVESKKWDIFIATGKLTNGGV